MAELFNALQSIYNTDNENEDKLNLEIFYNTLKDLYYKQLLYFNDESDIQSAYNVDQTNNDVRVDINELDDDDEVDPMQCFAGVEIVD